MKDTQKQLEEKILKCENELKELKQQARNLIKKLGLNLEV